MAFISPDIILRSNLTAPFDMQAIVVEEDTSMILSADTNIQIHDEHPIRLMTSLVDHKPELPGTVVVHGKSPYYFYAIVHDFDQYPSFQERWVNSSIDMVMQKSAELRIHRLAMQMLGSIYGSQPENRFMDYLTRRILEQHIEFPKQILVLD